MNKYKVSWKDLGVEAEIAAFTPQNKVEEYHVLLHVESKDELFEGQLKRIYEGEERLLQLPQISGANTILKRYFLSDATNQQPLMRQEQDCSISVIQQPPLDGSKIAVWMYLQKGTKVANINGVIVAEHNGYRHLWKMGMHEHKGDSAWQTESLLISYEETLQNFHATLADNCIRTWFFVRDVDTQYEGMVKARKANFAEQGLTERTHYISSTGIGGLPADTRALVQMGTYALTGFEPKQQRYLYAPTHLDPTYEYGVTFERGTVMEYGDRAHVFLSGTASINNKGEVLHIGNIVKQTERMWENVGVLLEEGGTSFDNVAQIIVYLRDLCDYSTVKAMFDKKFPDTPKIITLAPVCRPTWLIEMECIAVKERRNAAYRDF
ncbi:MAG: hypothetical protein LUC45_06580 [Paraprevotella sp.]|nr:hypothetical protein [Paraprevotella sp.]